MQLHLLTLLLTLATTLLAAPNLTPRTTPHTDASCSQNSGILSCCTSVQKQSTSSPSFTNLIGQDAKLLGFFNTLAQVPILGPLLGSSQAGVALQCVSISALVLNSGSNKCDDVKVCCYNVNNNNPQTSKGEFINALNNNNVNFCPNIKLLNL